MTTENQKPADSPASDCSPRYIGGIGNYYGCLAIVGENGKCFWSIENYDGHDWEEIPRQLFDALNAFQDSKENPKDHEPEDQHPPDANCREKQDGLGRRINALDVARCNGVGSDDPEEGWREGCETCLRRTAPRPERCLMMEPPAIIAFGCEFLIEPNAHPAREK